MRRLWPLTRSAVLARSSGVEGGFKNPSICLQMSMAMMSAPSCANRTACARPWPRAAPVMNATLPSTRPAITNSILSSFSQLHDTNAGIASQQRTVEVDDR